MAGREDHRGRRQVPGGEVDEVGGGQADVDHVEAPFGDPPDEGLAEGNAAGPHVPTHHDGRGRGLPAPHQVGQPPPDGLGDLLVPLLGHPAADVVCLEDMGLENGGLGDRRPGGGRVEGGGLGVGAAAGLLADPDQVGDQADAVADRPDGGPLRVLDLDGNLGQGEAPPFDQVEQLHVEREALQRRRLEQRACDVGPEGLEAALGVPVLAEQQGVGGQVDEAAPDLAQAPRPDQRGRLGVAPTPDHHVVALLHPVHQGGGLGRAVGQVGIGEHHGATGRHGHPGPHRRALPPVPIQAHHPVGARRLGDRRGVVRRAVVDHHHLDVPVPAGTQRGTQFGPDPGHRGADPVGLAVRRKHHGHPPVAHRCGPIRRKVLFPADDPEQEGPVGHGPDRPGHHHGRHLGDQVHRPRAGVASRRTVQQGPTHGEDSEVDQAGDHDHGHEDPPEADPPGVRIVAQRHRAVEQPGHRRRDAQGHRIGGPRRPADTQQDHGQPDVDGGGHQADHRELP